MNVLRVAARLVLLLPLIVLGLLTVGLAYPCLGLPGRNALNRFWSRVLLKVCGVRVRTAGSPCASGPVLWVANHVSWIDIFVLNSVRATAFVAKHEIRGWPVIGWLAAGAGTLFIERGQRHAVHTVGAAMALRFARDEAVGLFPEGTTSEGFDLLPFHASLFEPAREAQVTVQPAVLHFLHRGKRSGYAAFVGEETLVANLWRVLGTTGLEVRIVFLPALALRLADGTLCSRTELSRQAQAAMRAQLVRDA